MHPGVSWGVLEYPWVSWGNQTDPFKQFYSKLSMYIIYHNDINIYKDTNGRKMLISYVLHRIVCTNKYQTKAG